MKTSEHIQKLITELSDASLKDYNQILKNFDFQAIDFDSFQSWSSEKYTRNCLYRDEKFELILLCWEEGQGTSIHGHDGKDCWVYLLEGDMEEVLFSMNEQHQLSLDVAKRLKPHQLTFMNDRIGFHKLRNVNKGRSLSLHVYAKPIERCRFYDENTGQFIEKTLSFDTYKQFVVED